MDAGGRINVPCIIFPVTVHALLPEIAQRLQKVSETPGLDAQVLLASILERSRAWLLAHPEADLSPLQKATLLDALFRLEGGEPLPYVLGHWEFYGLEFDITPDVLIPRPETELLVEQALAWLWEHSGRRSAVDVGTGSGCIAISLAQHVPDLHILATDISPAALGVATRNAQKHGVANRIEFVTCDLLPLETETDPITRSLASTLCCPSIDLLTANLPYIPSPTLRILSIHGHEPTLALDGGADGLDVIRRLVTLLPQVMAPGGLCLLEIESTQGQAMLGLVKESLIAVTVTLHQDLAGRDRLIRIDF